MDDFRNTFYFQLGIYLSIAFILRLIYITVIRKSTEAHANHSGEEVLGKMTGSEDCLMEIEAFAKVETNEIAEAYNHVNRSGVDGSNMYSCIKAAYLSELYERYQRGGRSAKLSLWLNKYFAYTERFSGFMVFALLLEYFIISSIKTTGLFLVLLHAQLIIISAQTLFSAPMAFCAYKRLAGMGLDAQFRSLKSKATFFMLHFSHYFRAWGTYLQIIRVFRWLFSND